MASPEYRSPHENELENQKFKHKNPFKTFRGQPVPSDFDFEVSETDDLQDGQRIGDSRLGKILFWISNSVVTKG